MGPGFDLNSVTFLYLLSRSFPLAFHFKPYFFYLQFTLRPAKIPKMNKPLITMNLLNALCNEFEFVLHFHRVTSLLNIDSGLFLLCYELQGL